MFAFHLIPHLDSAWGKINLLTGSFSGSIVTCNTVPWFYHQTKKKEPVENLHGYE